MKENPIFTPANAQYYAPKTKHKHLLTSTLPQHLTPKATERMLQAVAAAPNAPEPPPHYSGPKPLYTEGHLAE